MKASLSNRLEAAVQKIGIELEHFQSQSTWYHLDEELLFAELVACLLGSQVAFECAQSAAQHLQENGLLCVNCKYTDPSLLAETIAFELSKPIFQPLKKSGEGRKYRYPILRSAQIAKTIDQIYVTGHSMRNLLKSCENIFEARSKLMQVASGIGPKQASLFLRNIYYSGEDVAILDSHVLHYMQILGLLRNKVNVSNLGNYEKIERILFDYSLAVQVKLSTLDTAIWVVMRVYRREFAN